MVPQTQRTLLPDARLIHSAVPEVFCTNTANALASLQTAVVFQSIAKTGRWSRGTEETDTTICSHSADFWGLSQRPNLTLIR